MLVSDLIAKYLESGEVPTSQRKDYLLLEALVRASLPELACETMNANNWMVLKWAAHSGNWVTMKGRVSQGWARAYLNAQIRRFQLVFRWGAEMQLIPVSVWQWVQTFRPVRRGSTLAKEYEPITAVEWSDVLAVKRHVSPLIWDMIRVQFLTGMRTNELVRLNRRELKVISDDAWLFSPRDHKMSRLKPKVIAIGTEAIRILKTYWPQDEAAPFFTKLGGVPLTKVAYAAKVKRGVHRAIRHSNAKYWHPHQLRHARAKIVDETMGREAACALLGNSPTAAAIYTERNIALAIQAAQNAVQPELTLNT